jgi:creatinine amidohydrolase
MEAGEMTRRINELNWEQFRGRVPEETDLVLVPVGTIEAHGAIPLGTDTIIPEALASDLASKLDALIAPAVAYGVTNSLLPYPGSTTVSSATFTAYLFEACAGLVDTGFRRVVILNGHGGQSEEVGRVVARLWNEKKAYAVAIDWWGLAEEASTSIYPGVVSGHAGVEETAMVLANRPRHGRREARDQDSTGGAPLRRACATVPRFDHPRPPGDRRKRRAGPRSEESEGVLREGRRGDRIGAATGVRRLGGNQPGL